MREVILLPGWGCDASCWQTVADDLPAHTVLPWQECLGETVASNALHQQLEACTAPVMLAGWSLGALIALGAAQRYPEKISAMLLLSATARLCSDTNYPGAEARALRAMIVKLQRNPARVVQDFAALSAHPEGNTDFLDAFQSQATGFDAETLVQGLQYFEQADYRDALDSITCPVHVMHGEADRIVPVESAQWLMERLPQATLEVLPDQGHALPYMASDDVIKSIEKLRLG